VSDDDFLSILKCGSEEDCPFSLTSVEITNFKVVCPGTDWSNGAANLCFSFEHDFGRKGMQKLSRLVVSLCKY
jgi:hypothetical protein